MSLANTGVTCANSAWANIEEVVQQLPFTHISGNEDCKMRLKPITTISKEDRNRLANCTDDLTITIDVPVEIPGNTENIGMLCYAYANSILGIIPGTVTFTSPESEERFKHLCEQ